MVLVEHGTDIIHFWLGDDLAPMNLVIFVDTLQTDVVARLGNDRSWTIATAATGQGTKVGAVATLGARGIADSLRSGTLTGPYRNVAVRSVSA